MDKQKIHMGAATLVSQRNGNGRRGVYKDRVSTKQAILIWNKNRQSSKNCTLHSFFKLCVFSLTQNPETSHIF